MRHRPHLVLDDWGYAVLVGDGRIAPEDRPDVMRALLDCPAHAIIAMSESDPPNTLERPEGNIP
ncbi:ferredoxin [Nocardia higoensis]|uniref:Ferredoxin n=1 Tax=Nocardia higoensis TaxID=228599 RepID=A0ABS0D6M5_9NOCA|nr:ferredoxin [Nocardia higoensis]MBF6354132.1 ferredoxin [Nocardia higoensis]